MTDTNAPVIEDQPPPIPNEGVPIWELVVGDMVERDRVGRERYGTPLQTMNGRDPLVDLYQELLDAVVYIRQHLAERDLRRAAAETGEVDEGAVERVAQALIDAESAALGRAPHAMSDFPDARIEAARADARRALNAVD